MRWLTRLRIRWNDRLGTLVAVTTLLLAGLATLATFQSATYGNDALLAQTELTNCWSYYQAKSIKQHLFQLHRDMLALEPSTTETAETLARYEEEIARYRQEKYALMGQAAELERTREESQSVLFIFSLNHSIARAELAGCSMSSTFQDFIKRKAFQ
ncbi:MAG: DUF4337 family protein, partial [Selenomonadales bacterium]|nr:DUF4337 family protein [Selenomonadales bacterium]